MKFIAYNIFVFSSFYIGGSGDWIEISQGSENVADKSSSTMKQYYTFPRNEYVYTQPSNANDKILQSPYSSTITEATLFEKYAKTTIKESFPTRKNKTTQPYSNDAPKLQNRMDESDEINVQKLVRVTEEPTEEMNDPSDESEKETENFIPFLKTVQDEITVKGHKNIKGKITMLKNLRDDLLLNIDERISHLWGGKSKEQSEAREHKEDDHDMHFPSNEGALMTIGFLTFAVFLIKLVLKLVQALKYKQSMVMVTPTMVAPNAAFIGRRKREAVYDEQNRILQLIDDYNVT